jgi:drug/metabolite transporter (DMT)-like permease
LKSTPYKNKSFFLLNVYCVSSRIRGVRLLLFFISILCLSVSGLWVRWSDGSPELLGFWRLFVASLALAIWSQKSLRIRAQWRAASSRTRFFAVMAGVLLFAHLWTYKYQAHHTRIANGMILFASNPLWTALFSMLFLKDRLNWRLAVAYLMSLAGIYILVSRQLKFEPSTVNGDLVALLSALLYSGYILSSQQARRQIDYRNFSLILFPIAAFCFLGLGLGRGLEMWPSTPRVWIAIFGLAVFSTLLGHGLFVYLLRYMNINVMSCGKLLEPVLAAIAAWMIFDENINSAIVISFALTAGGVLVLVLGRKRRGRV